MRGLGITAIVVAALVVLVAGISLLWPAEAADKGIMAGGECLPRFNAVVNAIGPIETAIVKGDKDEALKQLEVAKIGGRLVCGWENKQTERGGPLDPEYVCRAK